MLHNGNQRVEFELRLVGRVRLVRHDGVEVTPKGRKAQGLLTLLGVAPDLRRPRAFLQDKLWSDRGSEQGSASLRQELLGLRRALGDCSDCLVTEGAWVGLDPTRVRVHLDPEPGDWELTGTPPEFAAGLEINDIEFEEWIRDQRAAVAERLAQQARPSAPLAVAREAPPGREEAHPSIAVMPLSVFAQGSEGG